MTAGKQYAEHGFHTPPLGRLLLQTLDLNAQVGLAYESSVGFLKAEHAHQRLMIVCPRGACRMEVEVSLTRESFSLDSSHVLIVPPCIETVTLNKSVSTVTSFVVATAGWRVSGSPSGVLGCAGNLVVAADFRVSSPVGWWPSFLMR